ncbi:hypothetical protein GCM10028803_27550 [Larkinella knui]|uniref:T9SS C-terminal target domain-containing protein n=1 Tax=Larkinella knui TaxID=2025310 RepID=A0A3P1CWK1_9BACT|nr:hypothetical protein [Larkinella knui]RRB17797.1 hypothetical protein EHT87_05830 [Larkinella knui]
MKTIFSVLTLCLLSAGSLLAQTNAYYDSTKSKTPGYWEVSTDYRTNGTAIRYYTADQQLLHQETHPNKLVKLTKRNVRQLNATLTKVSQNQPEDSRVKTVNLPTHTEDRRVATKRKELMQAARRASSDDLMTRIVASANGGDAVLKVFIYNPHEERLRIEILNSKGQTVCQQYENSYQRYYRFNLSNMPSGDYRVQIFKSSERMPAVDNRVSLSRQPSQTYFSLRPEMPSGSTTDSLVSEKE